MPWQVMAMRNPRLTVFAGAIGALAAMTVLSAALGWAAPNLVRCLKSWGLACACRGAALLLV